MRKKLKNIYYSFLNGYHSFPIIIDSIIASAIIYFSKEKHIFNFIHLGFEEQLSLISNIISSSMTLAGFILAALTIIVTFKANVKAKGLNDAENALELILSSNYYPQIVRMFKKAIIELLLLTIFLYLIWFNKNNLNIYTISSINLASIYILSITTLRSMFFLFRIINL